MIRAGADAQRPTKYALDATVQHGRLHHVCTPFPEAWVIPPMSLDDVARDQRMPVEPARQRRHAHAVIDARAADPSCAGALLDRCLLPTLRVGVVREAAHERERVIDVAAAHRQPSARRRRTERPQCRPLACANRDRPRSRLGGNTMNDRMPACALYRLLACALRPVAVPNGNSDGRLRPSRPIGKLAFTMTPRLSRSACSPSIPGT